MMLRDDPNGGTTMPCQSCGIDAPTKYVDFYQNIGMLVTRQTAQVSGNLCRPCIGRYFRSYTITTLFLGWWGVISFIVTPFILLNNVIRYLLALRLPEPGMAAMNAPIGLTPPLVGSGSLKFRLIYGAIVCIIGLGVLAYYNVAFLEKHAPGLNAKLHDGEISDASDAEYSVTKIWKDIAALVTDTKSKDWAGYRSELLSREPSLVDLNVQNDKFQRRVAAERDANLDASDICEKLAITELVPALNDYTKSLNEIFSIVKNSATATPATLSSLHTMGNRQDGSLQRLRAYFSDVKNNNCDK